MAALATKDFSKPASSGPYAGSSRHDIFNMKIKDGKPFVLGPTKSGKKVTGKAYDKKSGMFTYSSGSKKDGVQVVKYTQVFKDGDFGGGAGSGGGADDTKYTESLQCYYCSYVFNVKKGKVTAVSDKQLKQGQRYVNADVSLDDALKNGPSDWVETDVYIKTANALWGKWGSKMSGGVYFHRGSSFMNDLYKSKSDCHKIDKSSGDPQAPGSFSHDKWNPGDIWASTFPPNKNPLEGYTSSWGELNARVYSLAKQGKLLGISLKKIGKNQAAAKHSEFNSPSAQNKREIYKFVNYSYGKTGDFFKSQDIYMKTSAGDVQFRTFGGTTSWQGEIKGGAAAGGKIGGGNVDFYCNQVIGKGIYGDYTRERDILAWVGREGEEYQQRLYELYAKHNAKSARSFPLMSEDEFMIQLSQQDDKFKNSKIICMEFLDTLMGATAGKRHDVVTKLFRYAQSDVDQSSYFVKVY